MRELHYRSFIKGFTWRILGTLDTVFLSWLFTGDIKTALKIGGVEIFTKIVFYYLHERIWLKVNYGRKQITLDDGSIIKKDYHHRSIIKGISWRLFGTLDTTLIAYFITGDYTKAFSIGFAEIFTKILLFYFHERVWNMIKFGSKPIQSTKSEKLLKNEF